MTRQRKWATPDNIAKRKILQIDAEVRRMSKQESWRSDGDAISFARRGLYVALEDVADFRNQHHARARVEQWEQTSKLAKRALQAMRKLAEHLGADGLPHGILFGLVRAPLGKSGRVIVQSDLRRKRDGSFFSTADAKDEAAMLSRCIPVLEEIVTHASDRREQLAHRRGKNADYEKRAFVYRLAETYIFLTGSVPGRGRTPEHNPFLRFAQQAAIDAGLPEEEDLYSALTWTVKTLERYETLRPRLDAYGVQQFSRESISGIARRGPVWADQERYK